MEKQHEILNKLSDLVDHGVITDRVTSTLKLSKDIQQAHIQQYSGKTLGKIALTVDF
jgi:NADPH:quinone reductase